MTTLDYGKMYAEVHENQKHLPGFTIRRYVPKIAELNRRFKPQKMLDYGSGKGFQYLVLRIHEKWGGKLPYCYDPGVRQLATKPEGTFDGVVCVDVMEHIAEADIDEVLKDLFSYAKKYAFIAVSCRPSRKTFPDGTNLHLTVQPPEWWEPRIRALAPEGLHVETAYELPEPAA